MKKSFTFRKNSAFNKQPEYNDKGEYIKTDVPIFRGTVDIEGKIYDADVYIQAGLGLEYSYGREVLTLTLDADDELTAPF
tara:strand:+ start:749 stop:988 length:240 start_codon:yes stop_codon:yes gene_type:complete